jgi:hypothetical protein
MLFKATTVHQLSWWLPQVKDIKEIFCHSFIGLDAG